MELLMRGIRRIIVGTEAAALVIDHFNKGGGGGNQASVRGGSSKVDAARVVITMAQMTADEYEKLSPPKAMWNYIRLDTPKTNYSAHMETVWLEMVVIKLPNGESRPAHRVVNLQAASDFQDLDLNDWAYLNEALTLVEDGRKGAPWGVSIRGRKESRLDQAMVDAGMADSSPTAQDYIKAMEAEGLIEEFPYKEGRSEYQAWRIKEEQATA